VAPPTCRECTGADPVIDTVYEAPPTVMHTSSADVGTLAGDHIEASVQSPLTAAAQVDVQVAASAELPVSPTGPGSIIDATRSPIGTSRRA
jgi:hypothetical protein